MKWRGLNVNGYHTKEKGNTDYGMQACSLTDIGNLKGAVRKEGETWENYLQELGAKFGHNYGTQGNFLFCISSTQLDNYKNNPDSFLAFLLGHDNTQIIHHYYNNAHGPCCLFICIHHMFPKDIRRVVKNNVAEYILRHKWNGTTYEFEVSE